MTDVEMLCFRGYRLLPVSRQLLDPDGVNLPLTGRAFDVLLYLVEHRDRVVSRDELLAEIWKGRVVEENNLTQAIAALRRSFHTGASDRSFVMTIPGRGYRFVASLEATAAEAAITEPEAATDMPPPSSTVTHGVEVPPVIPVRSRVRPGLLVGLVVALVAATLLVWWLVGQQRRMPTDTAGAPAHVASLAILPFRGIGTAARDDMLELGMAETLITRLSRTTGLRVLPLSAVEASLGREVDPFDAARRLGVEYVVQGSTQQVGEVVRVNARLLALDGRRSLWSGTFDASPGQVFTLQDGLATGVASALSLQFPRTTAHRALCDGADAEAYRAYLRGRHLMFRPDRERLGAALQAFDTAIARDPGCARAWAGKAFAYRSMAIAGEADPKIVFPQARDAVMKALAIDPASAEAYASKGVIEFFHDWDWNAAEASLRHAIALDPNLAEASYALAHLLHNTGRSAEALPHARRASQLDPLSPVINTIVGSFFLAAGQPAEASRRIEAVLELDPDFWLALFWRAQVKAGAGDLAAALADMQRASTACHGCSHALAGLAWLAARTGDEAQARTILATMRQKRSAGYYPATRLAVVHAGLGEGPQAMAMLEQAFVERDLYLVFLSVDRRLRELETQAGYPALLARLKLPAAKAAPGPAD